MHLQRFFLKQGPKKKLFSIRYVIIAEVMT